jgi:hypothetical protein
LTGSATVSVSEAVDELVEVPPLAHDCIGQAKAQMLTHNMITKNLFILSVSYISF